MVDELNARVETIEDVPENYRGLYREDESGGFVPNIKGVGDFELVNTGNLKSALQKERKSRSDLEGQLKSFERFDGLDPDEARTAIEKMKDFDAKNIDMDAEVQRKLKAQADQLISEHEKALGSETEKSQRYFGKLQKVLVDNEAIKAINELEGDVELLLPHVRSRVKVIENDGDLMSQVVTPTGEPAVDGNAQPIGIGALVKEFQTKFPSAFKGAGSSGTGSKPGSPAGKAGTKVKSRSDFEQMPHAERLQFVQDGGVVSD